RKRRRIMRKWIQVLLAVGVCAATVAVLTAASDPPAPWAYGFDTPAPAPGATPAPGGGGRGRGGAPPPPPDPMQYTVPGSDVKMTRAQIANAFNIGDWFPNDHAKMPYIVQYGKAPDVRACGLCHLVN